MFEGMTMQMIFLVVIGAVLLVTGTTSFRRGIRLKKPNVIKDGKVIRSKHVQKQDEKGFFVQNYYELRVAYEQSGHRNEKTVKSIDEYREGDTIRLLSEVDRGGVLRVYDDNYSVFGSWVLIGSGILIIFLPFIRQRYGDEYTSAILALLFLLIGIALILVYIRDKRRDTEEIEAEIEGVLKWQPERKRKWTTPSASYYPIIGFMAGGEKKSMRSRYNSSMAGSYKIGRKIVLYRDKTTGRILERGPRVSMLAGGIVLILFACVGIYSTFAIF
nr:hypothetical protein [uncultured Mediterraneibacter sp.]